MTSAGPDVDLSIIITADNQTGLSRTLDEIRRASEALTIVVEIIVIAWEADETTAPGAAGQGVEIVLPSGPGYGRAVRAGLDHARGKYILMMDPDQEECGRLARALWQCRDMADVIIASRYTPGGRAMMPPIRKLLSKMLNLAFSRGLDLAVRDMSSGFRLYRADVVRSLQSESQGYDILQEMLVRALMAGYRIREIPFEYRSHDHHLFRVIQFGTAYLRTYARLWRLRNSISSADYDARAYDTWVLPQRYWQRNRYKHITHLLAGRGRCLDAGCGSSRIIGALPPDSVILDISYRKLRYDQRYGRTTLQGSILGLPIADASFPCVICSQVIEHIGSADTLNELDRVLQPGGFLILGTPDYSKWQWILTERLYKILLPQAYADEHITHYTYAQLTNEFVEKRGYRLVAAHYILQGGLILGMRKRECQSQ